MIEKLNDIKENDNIGLDKEHINQQFLDSMKITNKNFIFAVEQKKKKLNNNNIKDIEKENYELKEVLSS